DILDMSKLEAGKVEIEMLDFRPADLLSDVIAMFKGIAKPGVAVELALADDLPDPIRADPTRLRQVLVNLVGNAVKFTHQGFVRLEAARQPGETDTPTLRFTVRDTGIGIDDNAIAGAFQHFTQADASINRQFEGSGLGLAICKGLVELMGGEIGVESRSGEGSTFWFTLPYEPAAMADATPADAVAPAGRVTGSRALRTLVAEDNQVNQAIISATLASFGHDLKIVDNGQACVDALLADDFDLILMDVRMPTMSGIEATQKIR
ncbi:MAG: ATP-binding protein, partial [Rhodospirillaceae bacterium]